MIIQTYGKNTTHYGSIYLAPLKDADYESVDNIIVYGTTEAAYDTPATCGLIKKCVDAVMTTDDFSKWDYTESETIELLKVWHSNGKPLWITDIDIDYCYCNMAIEVNPVITVDGVEYSVAAVTAVSAFDAFSDKYTEGKHIRTYIGTTLNKVLLAEEDDGKFIVTIPRIIGFSNSTDVPGGFAIFDMNYIFTIYENEDGDIIKKIQPVYIKQPE